MDNLNPALKSSSHVLTDSIFGKAMPAGAMLFTGALAGAILGYDPQGRAEPFLYMIAPAWFFNLFIKIWKLLKFPRNHTWPFILGLPYQQRLKLSFELLNRELASFLPLAFSAITLFTITQSFAVHHAALSKFTNSLAVFFAETAFLYMFILLTVKLSLITPVKRDFSRLLFFTPKRPVLNLTMNTMFVFSGNIARQFMPLRVTVLVQRQTMYLLRMDLFSLVVFPVITFAIAGALLFYLDGKNAIIADIAAIIAPFFLMMDRTPVYDESADKLDSCPYYRVSSKDRFRANIFFVLIACAPFGLLFLLLGLPGHCQSLRETAFRIAAFFSGMCAIAFTMSYRWLMPDWLNGSGALAGMTVLCAVLSCAVPVYGPLFSVLSILAVYFILNKNVKKCRG